MACQQRAKFEGWLKFELASALAHHSDFTNIILEDGYPKGGRSDLSFISQGAKWYVEMKTANTNWRAEGLENVTRPVTRNIDGIIDDILVLHQKCPPNKGMAVFLLFPVPVILWNKEPDKLTYHLKRIEEDAPISMDTIKNSAEFVQLTEHYGVFTFVIEVI